MNRPYERNRLLVGTVVLDGPLFVYERRTAGDGNIINKITLSSRLSEAHGGIFAFNALQRSAHYVDPSASLGMTNFFTLYKN